METLAPLVLALAFLSESLTEYLFERPLKALRLDPGYLRYVAAAVGVALALAYQVDILQDIFGRGPGPGWVGQALTGLLLGRGANYVHDFYGRYVAKKGGGSG